MATYLLEIVTPERIAYAGQVNMIIVKGQEGDMGILAQHLSLVTPLKIAPVIIKKDKQPDEIIAINGGFLEVRKEKVVILAESAEFPGDIDLERAKRAKERAEKRLTAAKDEYDFRRAEVALQKAMNRIDVYSHNIN